MPTYHVTGPDGGTYEINAPDGASQDQVLAFVQQQFGGPKAPAGAPAPNIKAPTGGFAMGMRDAVDAGAQMLRRAVPDPVGNAVDTFGNWLASKGLPVAPSTGVEGVDRIVTQVNQQYDQNRKDQTGGDLLGFDVGRFAGNLANPVNYVGGGAAAAARTLPELALAGARAGAAAGAMQPVVGDTTDFWSKKGEQAAAGAASGAVLTPLAARGIQKAATAVKGALTDAGALADPTRVKIAANHVFVAQGLDPKSVPPALQDSVQRQVAEALQQGDKLDPAAIVRRAQFEAVGLTGDAAPTAGQLTRDPMQWANEKNLSGVRLQTAQGEGNPLAQRFQNQNNRLQGVFDLAGASQATDRVTAGQTVIDALRAADQPVKGAVDDAYAAARAMTGGRAAELNRGVFSQTANKALDDGMWGHFLPPEVRNLLNGVSSGNTPFTVETAEQMDTILSAAQRRAGQGSPQASAIGVVRRALHDTPFAPTAPPPGVGAAARTAAEDAARTVDDVNAPIQDVPFRDVGPQTAGPLPNGQRALPGPDGNAVAPDIRVSVEPPQPGTALGQALPHAAPAVDEGQAARDAFAQARAAARQRFATIESTPALRAALDGEAPDRFVQNYIINANVGDLQSMKKVLASSPEALAQARAQLAEHLKNAAFGPNVSGDKAFSADRFTQVMRAIGPQKLQVFFSPEEIVRLNLAGKVASDINSKPAGATYAVNSSGTGAALMNMLSKIAGSPFLRNLPGARALANQVGEIQTERAINQALTPPATKQPTELSPQAMRALQLLFAPPGVAGGVLGGSSVNP